MKHLSARWVFFLIAALGIGGCIVGQALERFGPFPGCRLCHIERWILLVMGLFSFLTWVWWPVITARITGGLALISAVCGTTICLYHAGIQYHFFALPAFCSIQDASSLEAFLALPKISCDQRTLTLFSIPASMFLALAFAVSVWGYIYALKKDI